MRKKTIYLYKLTDCHGDFNVYVTDDPTSIVQISGHDKAGYLQTFENSIGDAGYWARSNGFTIDQITREVDLPLDWD